MNETDSSVITPENTNLPKGTETPQKVDIVLQIPQDCTNLDNQCNNDLSLSSYMDFQLDLLDDTAVSEEIRNWDPENQEAIQLLQDLICNDVQ